MTQATNEFIETLMAATGRSRQICESFAQTLSELATKHHILVERAVAPGLSEAQYGLWDAIEAQILATAEGQPGITSVRFDHDPRADSTVGLALASGAFNSMTGTWKVPVDPKRRAGLVASRFWEIEAAPALPASPGSGGESGGAAAASRSGYFAFEILDTGNAAFEPGHRDAEIARLLRHVADRVESCGDSPPHAPLYDINGNRVGEAGPRSDNPSGQVQDNAVRLVVELGNAAFDDGGMGHELARLLREAASQVERNAGVFTLRDSNGNTVARYEDRRVEPLDLGDRIDMEQALLNKRVYKADYGFDGLADGAYRYLVPTSDFEPGYGQHAGPCWLVNAIGEKSPDAEEPQEVREILLNPLTADERSALLAVAEGRMTLEEHERPFQEDDDEGFAPAP